MTFDEKVKATSAEIIDKLYNLYEESERKYKSSSDLMYASGTDTDPDVTYDIGYIDGERNSYFIAWQAVAIAFNNMFESGWYEKVQNIPQIVSNKK